MERKKRKKKWSRRRKDQFRDLKIVYRNGRPSVSAFRAVTANREGTLYQPRKQREDQKPRVALHSNRQKIETTVFPYHLHGRAVVVAYLRD